MICALAAENFSTPSTRDVRKAIINFTSFTHIMNSNGTSVSVLLRVAARQGEVIAYVVSEVAASREPKARVDRGQVRAGAGSAGLTTVEAVKKLTVLVRRRLTWIAGDLLLESCTPHPTNSVMGAQQI
jgi:hypothetical protein